MPNVIFEKSITRDWGIVYAQIWHLVFTEDFKKQLGWGYSEVVFDGKDEVISVYRAPQEHIEEMRGFILKKLDENPKWLEDHAEIVMKQFSEVVAWVKKIRAKPLSEYTNSELSGILRSFIIKNRELGPRFIMMLWFPIQMETYIDPSIYKFAIDVAVKTRGKIEKIGPLVDTFAREVALETAKRAKISDNLHRYIAWEEIVEFLEQAKPLLIDVLNERKSYFIVTNEGVLSESVFSYLTRVGYSLKQEGVQKSSEIKGRTAYPGLVKGVVKLIRNKNMFQKFNDGDVLVTSMTTPDFLPLIKKSSAFITDEGGITCHAAIAAREIKKPCIIGTKIATQVLKDGDMVEVDADKGIVRKLG